MQCSSTLLILCPHMCRPTSVRLPDNFHFWFKDMLDLFQRFCCLRGVVKVLPKTGQRDIDMHNSSRANVIFSQ